MPGNHDAYVRAGMGYAIRQWGDYMCGDHEAVDFPYLRRRAPLALIGLSSAVPTAPFMATGRLGAEQLVRLAELLDAIKSERLFRVVLIHHPPVTQAKPQKRLRDADALKHVLAAHGAELLLHGHDHVHMLNWLAGPNGTRVPAVGVPSASAAPGMSHNDAAYNLYRIDGAPDAWTCELTSRGINDARRNRRAEAAEAQLRMRLVEHRQREQRGGADHQTVEERADGAQCARDIAPAPPSSAPSPGRRPRHRQARARARPAGARRSASPPCTISGTS